MQGPKTHNMTTSAIKPHILIRTYSGDREWLHYCLASIAKRCPDIGLTVVAPRGHDMGCECVYVDPIIPEGYVDQQYTKLRANLYVPEDTTHVVHVDSDCLMLRDIYSLFANGKPIMLKTPWHLIDDQASVWRGITSRYVGFDPEFEYMRRIPLVYPIGIYAQLDSYLTNLHGPWEEWFPKIKGRKFSEFNILGAYADKFMADQFHWINTATDPLPELVARQGWSWGGIAMVKTEWDKILNEP